ncbi:hypothetical protein ES708_29641 [subsurface metagenome]
MHRNNGRLGIFKADNHLERFARICSKPSRYWNSKNINRLLRKIMKFNSITAVCKRETTYTNFHCEIEDSFPETVSKLSKMKAPWIVCKGFTIVYNFDTFIPFGEFTSNLFVTDKNRGRISFQKYIDTSNVIKVVVSTIHYISITIACAFVCRVNNQSRIIVL